MLCEEIDGAIVVGAHYGTGTLFLNRTSDELGFSAAGAGERSSSVSELLTTELPAARPAGPRLGSCRLR